MAPSRRKGAAQTVTKKSSLAARLKPASPPVVSVDFKPDPKPESGTGTGTESERARAPAPSAAELKLFEHLPALLAVLRGPELRYTFANERMRTFHGNRPLLGERACDVHREEDAPALLRVVEDVRRTGAPFFLRSHYAEGASESDGRLRGGYYDFSFQPLIESSGKIEGVLVFGVEVTEQVEGRQRLESLTREMWRGEERYRTFITRSSEGIWRIGTVHPIELDQPEVAIIEAFYREGYIAECNDAMAKMYGLPNSEELIGTRLDQLLVRDDPRNDEYLRAFIRSGYDLQDAESIEVDSEGKTHIFLNNLQGVIEGGKLVGGWGTQRDITMQRQAEEALRRSEEAARFLDEATRLLGATLAPEEVYRRFSRLLVPRLADWCTIYVADDMGGMTRVALAHADPTKRAWAEALGPQHQPSTQSTRGAAQVLRTGRSELYPDIPESVLATAARDEEELQLLHRVGMRSVICVPLTARGRTFGAMTLVSAESNRRYGPEDLQLAEELGRRAALAVDNARLYRQAQDAIQLRDDFLSVASHELKTPLTPLHLKLQVLRREAEGHLGGQLSAERVMQAATSAELQVRRLSGLVNDLLDVSRIRQGPLTLSYDDVCLSRVVESVVNEFVPQAAKAGCRIELDISQNVQGVWDRLRLEQVITNLLTNAIKYGAGKPIEVQVWEAEGAAHVSVKDAGIGIAQDDLGRIFEKFERAVSERHYGGLGLGLFITRTLVEAMGGAIEVESQPGRGATFSFSLPRQRPYVVGEPSAVESG